MRICSVNDCRGKHLAKGYCERHYRKWLKYGDPLYSILWINHPKNCSIINCENKYLSSGFCRIHYQRNWTKNNPNYKEKKNQNSRESSFKLKIEVLEYYSDNVQCKCCGEKNVFFLTIQHDNGSGNKHRKTEKIRSIYRWLKENNYPDGFSVLCYNCNCADGFYGICPHKQTPFKFKGLIKNEINRF